MGRVKEAKKRQKLRQENLFLAIFVEEGRFATVARATIGVAFAFAHVFEVAQAKLTLEATALAATRARRLHLAFGSLTSPGGLIACLPLNGTSSALPAIRNTLAGGVATALCT